jgi:hypothetical protein
MVTFLPAVVCMIGVRINDTLLYYYYDDRITRNKLCGHLGHKRSGYSILVENFEGEYLSLHVILYFL